MKKNITFNKYEHNTPFLNMEHQCFMLNIMLVPLFYDNKRLEKEITNFCHPDFVNTNTTLWHFFSMNNLLLCEGQ